MSIPGALGPHACPNPSIKRAFSGKLRLRRAAAHVER